MLPILRALKDRLLNEPTFFLYPLSAAAVVVADQVSLPGWVAPAAIAVFGVANRAVVVPERNVRAKRRRSAVKKKASEAGYAGIHPIVVVLLAILVFLILWSVTGSLLIALLALLILLFLL
jgi:hypothetical protein